MSRIMRIGQLLASPFFGGPERQVLGLARHLPKSHETIFLSLAERGLAADFLGRAKAAGFEAVELKQNWPHLFRSVREICDQLKAHRIDLLCTNGYKPDILGWLAARRAGIPVVSIAHGWTAATARVRVYEALDRWVMRRVDRVVAVSAAQAEKVAAAGIAKSRTAMIANAISVDEIRGVERHNRRQLEQLFPGVASGARPPGTIVVAAGRLSPEKGFDVLVNSAAKLVHETDVGFIVFGAGPLKGQLVDQIGRLQLESKFVLGGFREDLAKWLPCADVLVMSSHTEGLPVILLEGMAAGLPVVATSVGGIPEVVRHEVEGLLVASDDAAALGEALRRVVESPELRSRMSLAATNRVAKRFSVATQSHQYQQLFDELVSRGVGQGPRFSPPVASSQVR